MSLPKTFEEYQEQCLKMKEESLRKLDEELDKLNTLKPDTEEYEDVLDRAQGWVKWARFWNDKIEEDENGQKL